MNTEENLVQQVTLQAPISSWKRVDDILEITCCVLANGQFQGIDGATINYSKPVMLRDFASILKKPHRRYHSNKDGRVTGFHSAVLPVEMEGGEDAKILSKVIVFDESYASEVERKKIKSVSMEALIQAQKLEEDKDVYNAAAIEFLGSAGVDRPACDSCHIFDKQRISLEEIQLVEDDFFKKPDTETETKSSETQPTVEDTTPVQTQQALLETELPQTAPAPEPATPTTPSTPEPQTTETKPELETKDTKDMTEADKLKAEIKTLQEEKTKIMNELTSVSDTKQTELETFIKTIFPKFEAKVLLQGVTDYKIKERVLSFVARMSEIASGRTQAPQPTEPSTSTTATTETPITEKTPELSDIVEPKPKIPKQTEKDKIKTEMEKDAQSMVGLSLGQINKGALLFDGPERYVQHQMGEKDEKLNVGGANA